MSKTKSIVISLLVGAIATIITSIMGTGGCEIYGDPQFINGKAYDGGCALYSNPFDVKPIMLKFVIWSLLSLILLWSYKQFKQKHLNT